MSMYIRTFCGRVVDSSKILVTFNLVKDVTRSYMWVLHEVILSL